MARPHGEITLALRAAAAAGPCTVKELARRACVGYAMARMTASRMLTRGELQQLTPANKRPAVLALAEPAASAPAGAGLAGVLAAWGGSVRMPAQDSNHYERQAPTVAPGKQAGP